MIDPSLLSNVAAGRGVGLIALLLPLIIILISYKSPKREQQLIWGGIILTILGTVVGAAWMFFGHTPFDANGVKTSAAEWILAISIISLLGILYYARVVDKINKKPKPKKQK